MIYNPDMKLHFFDEPYKHVLIENIMLPEIADEFLYSETIERFYEKVGLEFVEERSNWNNMRMDFRHFTKHVIDGEEISLDDENIKKLIYHAKEESFSWLQKCANYFGVIDLPEFLSDTYKTEKFKEEFKNDMCYSAYMPVSKPTRYGQAIHNDFVFKPISGMIYFRHPDDVSAGTDMFDKDRNFVKSVDNIHNTAFIWPNIDGDTYHRPALRQPSPFHRKIMNIKVKPRKELTPEEWDKLHKIQRDRNEIDSTRG